MLFRITSQHNWETCEGYLEFKGENAPPRSERQSWLEGNDKVKVIEAYGCQTQHRYYPIVESNNYDDVRALFSGAGHLRTGEVEVVPINDGIANIKSGVSSINNLVKGRQSLRSLPSFSCSW